MEQFFSSPVQSDHGINDNMAAVDECECDIAKAAAASSARSPTCVISAVDDEQLGGVSHLPGHDADDATAEWRCQPEQDQQEGGTTGGGNVGPLLRLGGRIEHPCFLHPTRCLTPSYANEELVELSTFSNEESSSSSSSSSSDCSVDHRYLYLPTRRRRAAPLMSIFRPMSCTKRRCDFEEEDRKYNRSSSNDDDDDDDDGCGTPTERPSLRHANPVRSGEYGHDAHDAEISLSSTYSFASAFKRICRSASSSSSSYSSLLTASEEGAFLALPLAVTTIDGCLLAKDPTAVSTMTIFKNLQHPLSTMAMTPSKDIEFHHNPKDDNEGI
jgi:hypothetical protein